MVGHPALRESVQFAKELFKLTERKACRYLSAERSFVRYKKLPDYNVEVKARINHWVEKRPHSSLNMKTPKEFLEYYDNELNAE
ncbi:MAG: hypothetical protein KBD76_10470 [Bacteriovorax sp.]|nr:hypothetical protein [Bacteriovorax sp.]